MLAGIITYGKSHSEKKIDKCKKNVGALSAVHIPQKSRAKYGVFSIG